MASPSLCRPRLAKFVLFSFNILLSLIGLVILAVGVWVFVNSDSEMLMNVTSLEGLQRLVQAVAVTYTVIGFIVFITTLLSCCSIILKNASLLLAYVMVIGCILVLQCVTGIIVTVFDDKILSTLSESMNTTVTVKYDGESGRSKAYDFMQYFYPDSLEFRCCAVNGPEDWNDSQWQLAAKEANGTIEGLNMDQVVPLTCCPLTSYMNGEAIAAAPDKCMAAAKDPSLRTDDVINTQGCFNILEGWIVDNVAILLIVAFGFVALEALGMILGCYVLSHMKKGYNSVH